MLKLNSLRPWKLTDHGQTLQVPATLAPCSHPALRCLIRYNKGGIARRNLLGSLQSPAPRQVAVLVLACAVLCCPTDSTGLSPLLTRFVARSLSLSFGSEPLSRSTLPLLFSSPHRQFSLCRPLRFIVANRLPAGLSLIFSFACQALSHSFLRAASANQQLHNSRSLSLPAWLALHS